MVVERRGGVEERSPNGAARRAGSVGRTRAAAPPRPRDVGAVMGILLYSFGPSYALPLPLSAFQWAGAAVVGISFIMMTVFAGHRTGPTAIRYPSREVAALNWAPGSGWLHVVGGFVGVLGLLTVIVTGLLGPTEPEHNLAVYLTWVYFWAGMAVLTGLVGPLWDAINPFRALNDLVSRARSRPTTADADAAAAEARAK